MPPRHRIGPLPPVRRKRPPRRPPTKPPPRPQKPRLHIYSILAWADAYHQRTARWPNSHCGPVHEAPWDTWGAIAQALRHGLRGCRGGDTLALLLHRHRGRPLRRPPPPQPRPRLTIQQILAWADAYHRRTGHWPTGRTPGPVASGRDETWPALGAGLRVGVRGLPGGDTLASVLHRCRGVQRGWHRPRLTVEKILTWADTYHARHGQWPTLKSGKIKGPDSDTWGAIHTALEAGARGLQPGYTLATLLAKYRGTPFRRTLRRAQRHWRKSGRFHRSRHAPLTVEQILGWADEFYRRERRWPALHSGPIAGARDEIWESVASALSLGLRGLPGGSSLAKLLEQHRGRRNPRHLPPFRVRNLLVWADAHHRRHGSWPKVLSGPIPESPGDTWLAVEGALRTGCRGLPGGDTLFRLLQRHGRRRTRNRA